MTSAFHLAEINLAHLKEPMDSALLKGFVDRLDEINALAEASPGFVWRYLVDSRDTEGQEAGDPEVIVNMSVWQDMAALHHYVYKTAHNEVFAQRKDWFYDWRGRLASTHMSLWWVPVGHIPTVDEAMIRAKYMLENGPSAYAFSFKQAFDASGKPVFKVI
jgi:heme-degrading monooxygenase HmoA